MVNDPIGDMLAQIKNAAMARKTELEVPFSKVKLEVAKTLVTEGYLHTAEKMGTDPKSHLHMKLGYTGELPTLTDLKRKSKPGLRVYVNRGSIPTVVGGMGVAILSTPKGIMTGRQAKKLGIGGELLCEVW